MRHRDNYNATLGARGASVIASVVGGFLPDGFGTVKRKTGGQGKRRGSREGGRRFKDGLAP